MWMMLPMSRLEPQCMMIFPVMMPKWINFLIPIVMVKHGDSPTLWLAIHDMIHQGFIINFDN